jgi:ATP-binding cassette subfamily C protein CydD
MKDADPTATAWLKQQMASGRRRSSRVLVLSLVSIAMAIGQAFCAADSLGAALSGASHASLPGLIGFGVLALGRALLGVASEAASFKLGAVARRNLRDDTMARLLAAGGALLRRHHTAELGAAVVDQVEALDPYFARWIPAAFLAVAGPLLVALALALIDWRAALLLSAAGLLVPVGMAVAGIGAAVASRRQFQAMTRLQTRFLDRVRGIATIVLCGRAEDEATRLGQAAAELRVRTMRVLRVAFLSSAILDCAAAAALISLALRYAAALLAGRLAHPEVALFALLLVPEFFAPLRAYAAAYQDQFQARAAAETLAHLPPLPEPEPLAEVRTVAAWGVSVAFENVTVTWDPARGPALDGMSFRVPAGETLVVAGPSGAGKSTIFEVLLGFVRPDSGRVILNGADIISIVPHDRLDRPEAAAVCRFAARQYPLRPPGSDRFRGGGSSTAGAGHQFLKGPASRAGYDGGRGRLWPVRWSGAAGRGRPCFPQECATPAAG